MVFTTKGQESNGLGMVHPLFRGPEPNFQFAP